MHMIEKLFVTIFGMSIAASLIILAVLMLRLVLRRTPKIFSYFLWLVVLVRLLCPVAFKADFGIWPDYADLIAVELPPEKITDTEVEGEIHAEHAYIEYIYEDSYAGGGVPGIDSNGNQHEYHGSDNSYPGWQSYFSRVQLPLAAVRIMMVIWLAVGFGLLIYEGVSYVFFMKGVKEKGAQTPFTAGIFHPQIYLPEGLDEIQRELVTEHEQMHIKRLDYLVKPVFFLVCCIYWFNPLVWLAFYLMESDMESSCDEAVLRKLGYDRKKDYAYTLLALCETNGWKLGYPIAFGERNIKNRIKDAAKAKKAPAWMMGIAAVVVAAAAVVLMVNQSEETVEYLPETKEYLPDERIVWNDEEERYSLPNEGITVMGNGDIVSGTDHEYYVSEGATASSLPNEGITVMGNGDIVSGTDHEYYVSEGATASASHVVQIGEPGEELPLGEVIEYEYVEYSENGTFDTTIMNYDPERERDMYEVLILPNPESYEDVEIRLSVPLEVVDIRDGYGTRIHPPTGETLYHSGLDFAAEEGTPVMAAAEGTVVQTGWDADCGNYIILAHRNGTYTYYSGCKEILAEGGAQVERGEQIATVGKTGRSTGAHLHFAASKDGKYFQPVFTDEMAGFFPLPDSVIQELEKVDN